MKGPYAMRPWYEELYDDYGEKYDSETFAQGTIGECDFLEKEIGHNKATRILDIGCGTGRHSLELARRGYAVVGIDLSESLLRKAEQKASERGLDVVFLKHDARNLPFAHEFDLAIMLCEGAFPLMETDGMNFRILQGAANALRPGGKLVLTTLNGLFPLFHSVKEFHDSETKEGNATYGGNSFDLMTFRDNNTTTVEDDLGNRKVLQCNERYYVPSEMTWLLQALGFTAVDIFGAKLGAFSRADGLSTEDFEMLVIAEMG
jgi:SAM-dependent methyltransferase